MRKAMIGMFSLGVGACSGTMPPVSMTFIDDESGHPVAGANVLFLAQAHEGTFTGHGGGSVKFFLTESTTDSAGTIAIPAQTFGSHPFLLATSYDGAVMVVFKPGFEPVKLGETWSPKSFDSVTHWQHDQQTVRLKPVRRDEEQLRSLRSATGFAEYAAGCRWQMASQFFVAVDKAMTAWRKEHSLEITPDPTAQALVTPIEELLAGRSYIFSQRCRATPQQVFNRAAPVRKPLVNVEIVQPAPKPIDAVSQPQIDPSAGEAH